MGRGSKAGLTGGSAEQSRMSFLVEGTCGAHPAAQPVGTATPGSLGLQPAGLLALCSSQEPHQAAVTLVPSPKHQPAQLWAFSQNPAFLAPGIADENQCHSLVQEDANLPVPVVQCDHHREQLLPSTEHGGAGRSLPAASQSRGCGRNWLMVGPCPAGPDLSPGLLGMESHHHSLGSPLPAGTWLLPLGQGHTVWPRVDPLLLHPELRLGRPRFSISGSQMRRPTPAPRPPSVLPWNRSAQAAIQSGGTMAALATSDGAPRGHCV